MAVKASAPKPGVTRRAEEKQARAEADKLLFQITYEGRTVSLSPALIGPADDRECLAATGRRLSDLITSVSGGVSTLGLDGVCALWWAARRASGDVITYAECEAEFPSMLVIAQGGMTFGWTTEDESESADPNG